MCQQQANNCHLPAHHGLVQRGNKKKKSCLVSVHALVPEQQPYYIRPSEHRRHEQRRRAVHIRLVRVGARVLQQRRDHPHVTVLPFFFLKNNTKTGRLGLRAEYVSLKNHSYFLNEFFYMQ